MKGLPLPEFIRSRLTIKEVDLNAKKNRKTLS